MLPSLFQSKAAYVLFYQRRDLSAGFHKEASPSSSATGAAACNGNGGMKVNGDASSVEDMDIN